MKKTLTTITTIIAILLFAFTTKAQTILSPSELKCIHQYTDSSAVSKLLADKGYKPGYGWQGNGEKVNNWIFQARADDFADLTLRKVTTGTQTKTLYWIKNPFQYKQFMSGLVKENYKFSEIRVIDDDCYAVFKNKESRLLIIQRGKPDGPGGIYYEASVD
jgi:hypothetical protein